ncbi:efflux RND transporter periplasmic adaptor subunit [Geopsychrobacter electrodiphilus]|uniref:efflux RND transporter periplasmic adaptor subunit n=1 Tax=Geopsychrobacter electrodiphilus TaxID=225196 RepID=UPI00036E62DD|nr:efflux RND transporter periplasmic adaptor subunit [Geopsychrobacter electrodiphilus]
MRFTPTLRVMMAILCGALLLPLSAIQTCAAPQTSSATGDTASAGPQLMTLARPELRTFIQQIPWIGRVETKVSVKLSAPLAGQIATISVEDQARVKKGQLLVTLGGFQVEGERARLTAEVESLHTQLELAQQTRKRLKESLQAQLATKDQLAAALRTQVQLETRWHEALTQQKLFEKKILITAPTNGIFTQRRVSLGQQVKAGEVIADVIDLDQLRVLAFITPAAGVELRGREARLQPDQMQPALRGVVQAVLPQASATGALQIWIEGPQINRLLRPDQTVAGTVTIATGTQALAVPQSAIIYDAEENPLIFVQKNQTFVPQYVQLGQVQNGWVEVLSGLSADQTLVTEGGYELFYRQFNKQFKVAD